VFQSFDIDYITERQGDAEVPVLRMFGVNDNGNSVAMYVQGFEPYFYIESPMPDFGPDDCDQMTQELNVRCIPPLTLRPQSDISSSTILAHSCIRTVSYIHAALSPLKVWNHWYKPIGTEKSLKRLVASSKRLTCARNAAALHPLQITIFRLQWMG
jgi:hypothetical protein